MFALDEGTVQPAIWFVPLKIAGGKDHRGAFKSSHGEWKEKKENYGEFHFVKF